MRHRRRTSAATAVAAAVALLAAAGCWDDIKEPQADSVGAYEPATQPGVAAPAGDTLLPPAPRDSVGPVLDPPATPAAPATPTPRTPPPAR